MNNNIEEGKSFFEERNFKKALSCFRLVGECDENYELALFYMIQCFVEINQYGDALEIINPLIEKQPNNELLLFNKVTCHIFLNEDEKAFKTLNKLEKIVDDTDKAKLVYIAKLYNVLDDFDRALLYCNKALDIDENYREALHEKSLVAIGLDNDSMINEVADKFIEGADDDLLSLLPVFLLKLFSKNYKQSLEIIENSSKIDVGDDIIHLFKSIVFKRICEDLMVNILTVDGKKFSIDDGLSVLFDFIEFEKDSGYLNGIQYFII